MKKEDKKQETEEEQEESAETVEEAEAEEETEVISEKEAEEEKIEEEVVETEEPERVEEETPTPTEEEVKPPPPEEKLEEEIVEERIYTIPLGRAWIGPPNKRAPRAVRLVKSFMMRHMKLRAPREAEEEPKKLIISNEVNEKVWRSGIEKPPRKIRVRAARDREGNVTVYLAEGD